MPHIDELSKFTLVGFVDLEPFVDDVGISQFRRLCAVVRSSETEAAPYRVLAYLPNGHFEGDLMRAEEQCAVIACDPRPAIADVALWQIGDFFSPVRRSLCKFHAEVGDVDMRKPSTFAKDRVPVIETPEAIAWLSAQALQLEQRSWEWMVTGQWDRARAAANLALDLDGAMKWRSREVPRTPSSTHSSTPQEAHQETLARRAAHLLTLRRTGRKAQVEVTLRKLLTYEREIVEKHVAEMERMLATP